VSKGIYGTVFAILRPYRGSLVLAVALGILATTVSLAQPLAIGQVVRRIEGHDPTQQALLVLFALFAADGLLGGLQVYTVARVGTKVVLDIRRSMVGRLLRAPLRELLARQHGDIFACVVGDTSLLRQSLAQSLATFMVSGLMVVGSVTLMTFIDPILTLVTFVCLTAAAVVSLVIAWRLRLAAQHTRARVGAFGSALQRAFGAFRTIKISRAEAREQARIDGYAVGAYHAAMRGNRLTALMSPAMNLGIQASFAAVFTFGAARLAAGQLDTPRFAAYLLYLFYLVAPLVSVFVSMAQLQQGLASVARIRGILTIPTEDAIATAPARVEESPPLNGSTRVLRFEHVTFGYRPETPVLRDLSLDIPERGMVAIVGPSGAGKSTIFSLVERFWDVDAGRIAFRGTDIRDLPRDELRARIGYVEQDCPVLDGTIRENLLYADPHAGADRLDEAIDRAGLRRWVDHLDAGLDTPVGEGGATISGGERQRIAIARMLILRPDVLLLDEATSQLDAETEAALRRSLRRVATERAVVAIAHRMSTVVEADQIFVLEDGRIRAHGTHADLLATDELYRRLVSTQLVQNTAPAGPPVLADAPRS